MSYLAFDTTHSKGSICLSTPQGLKESAWELAQSHAEVALSYLDQLLKSENLNLKNIEALIINNGPGSFTGIRISVNIVKALAYTHNLPIYCYNTLDTIAHATQIKTPLLVAINAHSNLCYAKIFNGDIESEIQVLTIEALTSLLNTQSFTLAGDFFDLMKESLKLKNHTLLKEDLETSYAKNLMQFHQTQEDPKPTTWSELVPFYIRKSSPEEKLNL